MILIEYLTVVMLVNHRELREAAEKLRERFHGRWNHHNGTSTSTYIRLRYTLHRETQILGDGHGAFDPCFFFLLSLLLFSRGGLNTSRMMTVMGAIWSIYNQRAGGGRTWRTMALFLFPKYEYSHPLQRSGV